MYEEFYGFKELPFSVTPDPRFLSRSVSHRDALQTLEDSIDARLKLFDNNSRESTGD